MNLKVRHRRYVRDAKTSRDHTGTIPGTEEARSVAAYARVASADLARRAIGFIRPAYTRGLPTTAVCTVSPPQSHPTTAVCTVSPPQSPRLYARNGDVTALLPSDDYKRCDHQHPPGRQF